MIRFIPNARDVALRSYALWANRLGILALVAPEVWYAFAGYDVVSPGARWVAGLGLMILAEVLRYVDQRLR